MAPSRAPRPVSIALGTFGLLAGLSTLAGWATDTVRLTDWDGDGISTQPNAAFASMCAGLAIVLGARRRAWVAVLGAVCVAIGMTTLFEHLTNLDLGIDTLLIDKPWGAAVTAARGRMGPPAATSFTLLGLGLLLSRGRIGGRARALTSVFALVAASIAMLAITGYVFGADILYRIPRLTGIAFQTAVILLALGFGLAAMIPERQPVRALAEDSAAGTLARRALPWILVIPLTLGWVSMRWQKLGLYDPAMGSSLLVVLLMVLMCGVLWWGVWSVGVRENAIAAINEARIQAELRAQHALQESEGRMQLAMSIADAATWDADLATGKIYWSDSHFTLLGYAPTETRESTNEMWERAVVPEDLESIRERWEHAERERQMFLSEHRLRRVDDGRVLWSRAAGRFFYDDAGKAVRFVGVWYDITELKRSEEELRRLAADLRQADARKDEFLATLAHELRNPLAPIRNAVAILRAKGSDDPELTWAREMATRQVEHMSRLLDDLLDVSRITRNDLHLRKERVALADVVSRSLETCQSLFEAAGHQLEVTLPDPPVLLDADPVRMAQVLSNLLTNAAKYTDRGGRVTLAAVAADGCVTISVRDTGIGLAADHLPRVFEIFSQVAPALERSQGGLGIGLSLVRRIVELHGGTVEARSEGLGKGSEFMVRIPLATGDAPRERDPEPAEVGAAAAPLRIVLADDNADALESLTMLLRLSGHEVHPASDGGEAVELANRHRPDVIFLDLGMPRMNGYEAARRIRAEDWAKGTRILALTGWGQAEDVARARDAGFDYHIVKPVDPDRLEALLRSFSLGASV